MSEKTSLPEAASHVEATEIQIARLEQLADASTEALDDLLGGSRLNLYHPSNPRFSVALGGHAPDSTWHPIIGPTCADGYKVGRPLELYSQLFRLNVSELVDLATQGPRPHLVVELGPGNGRALHELEQQFVRDPRYTDRGIQFFGLCDRHQIQYSTLLGNLLGTRLKQQFEAEYPTEPDGFRVLQCELFIAFLAKYLRSLPVFEILLLQDINAAIIELTRVKDFWSGLADHLAGRFGHQIDEVLLSQLRLFEQDPYSYFRGGMVDGIDVPYDREIIGIHSDRIILSGDMTSSGVLEKFENGSVSMFFDLRASVYPLFSSDLDTSDALGFFKNLMIKLRPGGILISDSPRGIYDSSHHYDFVQRLRDLIEGDPSLRNEFRVFSTWGPSGDFPHELPNVICSILIVRRSANGVWLPLEKAMNGFGHARHDPRYRTLVEVTPETDLSTYHQEEPPSPRDNRFERRTALADELMAQLHALEDRISKFLSLTPSTP